jgi:hypothetical protein
MKCCALAFIMSFQRACVMLQIADTASREWAIENALYKMEADWEHIHISLLAYRETGTFILKLDASVMQLLDDHSGTRMPVNQYLNVLNRYGLRPCPQWHFLCVCLHKTSMRPCMYLKGCWLCSYDTEHGIFPARETVSGAAAQVGHKSAPLRCSPRGMAKLAEGLALSGARLCFL